VNTEQILTIVLTAAGSGGFVAIINGIFGKRKSKAEVADIMIKKSMEIEEIATKRYLDTNERLAVAESKMFEMRDELHGLKKEIELHTKYANMLKKILDKYQIAVPEWEDFANGKAAGFGE